MISPVTRAQPRSPKATLYAHCGRPVQFARLAHDRLLRSSALDACIAWQGPHTPMDLSAPAMHWLARAQRAAQRDGILLTPPPALAQELHAFADIYCMPRVGRAARRSLIDHLSCDTFASTWAQTRKAEPSQSTSARRCVAWGLEHLQALAACNAWCDFEDDDPESFRAWVVAALARLQEADDADWRDHDAAYVWVLQAAERLGLPIAHIPLPGANQVARNNLTELCAWLLDRPIWKALGPAAALWAQGRAVGREDYAFCLLREGVSGALFTQLQPHLRIDTPDDRLRLLELLPVYAERGSKRCMSWLLSQASQAPGEPPAPQVAWQKACLDACEAALQAHRSDVALWLIDTMNPSPEDGILTKHASQLACCVAHHTPEALPTWLNLLRAHGVWEGVDHHRLLGSAVKSGQVAAAQTVLAALTPQTRHAVLTSRDMHAPIRQAMQRGDVAMFESLLRQLTDSKLVSDLLTCHARMLYRLSPRSDASSQDVQAQWGGHVAVLRMALPHVSTTEDGLLVDAWVAPWAEACAKLADQDTLRMLIALRPTDAWRMACVQKLLPVWLAWGGGKQGVRLMLDALAPEAAARLLESKSVHFIAEAIRGGDVEMLQWLATKIAPRPQTRLALYTQAILRDAALFDLAERGRVAMARFWLCDDSRAELGAEAVAQAGYIMLEQAAAANQPEILDMALSHIQNSRPLNAIMARYGATMVAFAIQNGHHAMVNKLLALPTSDATRLAILDGQDDRSEGGNSPLAWAQRLGDLRACKTLMAWAPADFRASMQQQGSLGGIITACDHKHLHLARYLLAQGPDEAKRAMFAVHTGKLLTFAACNGDVSLLEEAARLAAAS